MPYRIEGKTAVLKTALQGRSTPCKALPDELMKQAEVQIDLRTFSFDLKGDAEEFISWKIHTWYMRLDEDRTVYRRTEWSPEQDVVIRWELTPNVWDRRWTINAIATR